MSKAAGREIGLKFQGFSARAAACALAITGVIAPQALAQPAVAPSTAPAPAAAPRGHPAADATIAVTCTVAAQAALSACEIATPGLTAAEQARVLDRASKSTTDPALAVGTRRAFGIVEGLKDFSAPGAVAPRLALVREDALVGVAECVWNNLGLHGQEVAAGTLRMGASMQVTRQNLQAEPTWAPAIAKCDPGHAGHATLADTIIPAYAMKAAARDQLARNGVPESALRQAWAATPALRDALEVRTIAVLRNATDTTALDWTPYLTRLHMLTDDPRARYAQLYFRAEVIQNVLIYQEASPW